MNPLNNETVNAEFIKLKPLEKGTMAPYFSGLDQFGEFHSLETLKTDKPIVLFFYRGYWCGACIEHLTEFQNDLDNIDKDKFRVVVVTNEAEEFRGKTLSKSNFRIPVLIDFNNSIMKSYQVAFPVGQMESMTKKYNFETNIEAHKLQGKSHLPIPATYVIDKTGIIKYVHYNPDFYKRASVKTILEQIS